jgi:hypothetical protein
VEIPFRLAMVLSALFCAAVGAEKLAWADDPLGYAYLALVPIGLLRAVLPARAPRPARRALGAWWPPSKDPEEYR